MRVTFEVLTCRSVCFVFDTLEVFCYIGHRVHEKRTLIFAITSYISQLPPIFRNYLLYFAITFYISQLPSIFRNYLLYFAITFYISQLPSIFRNYLLYFAITFYISQLPSIFHPQPWFHQLNRVQRKFPINSKHFCSRISGTKV